MCRTPSDVKSCICKDCVEIMEDFLDSVRQLGQLQQAQAQALVEGDPDFSRFDILIHMANERKDRAKYAWLIHVDKHHC